MKRLLLAALVALIVGAVAAAAIIWQAYVGAESIPAAQIEVMPGATMGGVARDLEVRGLLHHRRVLLLAARLTGRDRDLRVGVFALPAGASPRDILDALTEQAPLPVVVTLPEGMAAIEMAAVVADSLGLEAAAILAAADILVSDGADTLMTPVGIEAMATVIEHRRPDGSAMHWCEGYLAPDTYHFTRGMGAAAVAQVMVDLQLERVAGAAHAGMTAHELLSLAALVEAESRHDHERPLVAAVYRNRLRRGMRLEADPTVAFWLGKRGQRLLYRDLEVDSPFNTYRRPGLPVGPVLAPGLAAIMAAGAPDTTCDALYFVADGDGGHVFSNTLAEHNRAVAHYRELMRRRRR